ncbi:hypothetical protein FRC11_011271 [Ceratobasidium sp. 423]|nr:hypothetical protein FRC11_011271 [Ceratobasidium sp. 423]
MDSTSPLSRSPIDREAIPDEGSGLTDTAILLQHYRLNEVRLKSYKIGRGTPQGHPISLRPRLVPVSRWLAPKPMSSFNAPRRQPCTYLRDPQKAKNFRSLCWLHTESQLLAKSPLNDTAHRAIMPARPKIPLRGSMFCPPPPLHPPPNALRAFGTILPVSTMESRRLSTPLPRDNNGYIIGAPRRQRPAAIRISAPPPGITTKSALHPCPDGARVMVHRMNLARQSWNTARLRTQRLSLYNQLALIVPSTSSELIESISLVMHKVDGICAYMKKMAVIEGSKSRHKEAKTLTEIRDSFHKLLQTKPIAKRDSLPPQELDCSLEDSVFTNKERWANSQPPSPRTPKSNVQVTLPLTAQESTRKANLQHSMPTDASIPAPSKTRRQPRKEAKAKQAPSTGANASPPIAADSIPTTSRYNLRPRKRELDHEEASGRDNKQASRPTKRRRA